MVPEPSSLPSAPGTPEHVVMLVVNDVTNDNRVKRSAVALAEAGLRVTVVGRARDDRMTVRPLGDAVLLRIPVPLTVRRDVVGRMRQRRARRPLPATWATESARAARRARMTARAADRRGFGALAKERLARSAYAGAEIVDHSVARLWERWDRWVQSSTVRADWRNALGGFPDDLELAFGPVIDALEPDVVHAHDVHLLGVAARAVERAATRGRHVRLVYDAHEYVAGLAVTGSQTARSVAGWAALEAEYAPRADAVVAVSPHTGDALVRRLHLRSEPVVVLNTPVPSSVGDEFQSPSLRERCGLRGEAPLLVYSGGLADVRGVDVAARALALLPQAHLAVLCVPGVTAPGAVALARLAEDLGVADRVHLLDPVGPSELLPLLSGADIGLIPMRGGFANHELTLPNKLFEYSAAGVPLVVSDLTALGEVVRRWGIGATFTPGDEVSLAEAVGVVLRHRDRYRRALAEPALQREFSWSRQEARLREVYERLLGHRLRSDGVGVSRGHTGLEEQPARHDERTPRVLLGPLNAGGRASVWADRLRQDHGIGSDVLMVGRRRSDPVVAMAVDRVAYRGDPAVNVRLLHEVLTRYSHVVLEDAQPVTSGTVDLATELADLRHAGIGVVVVLHRPPAPGVVDTVVGAGCPILTADPDVARTISGCRLLPADDVAAAAELADVLGLAASDAAAFGGR